MSVYQSCSHCGGTLDAALNRCPTCGTERVQGRSARRKRRQPIKVAGWFVALATLLVFAAGTAGGFLYRSGAQRGPSSVHGVQLQPLPISVADELDETWAAVLRVEPKGAGGSREGTGFFIDRGGHLVTAAHVVEGGQCVTLFDQNGRSYEGAVLGLDRLLDVALVRVVTPAATRAYFPLAEKAQSAVGTQIAVAHLVTGNRPLEQTGELVRTGLAISIDGRHLQNLMELKGAGVVSGMSGGPVIERGTGRAIGILVAASEEGDGYAIPLPQTAERLKEWSAAPTPTGCTPPVASVQTPLQLATVTPLSGLLGVWGADVADGAALALREMEAALLQVGYQVTLRRLDDAGSVERAREQAALVGADPRVVGVVGSLTNPLSEAVYEGLSEGGKVHMIPATPAEAPFAGQGRQPFRLVPAVNEQMARLIESLRQQPGLERVLLVNDGTALGAARTDAFAELAVAKGLQVVDWVSISPEVIPEELYRRVSQQSPDLIYYGGSANTLRAILEALPERPWLLAGGAELADRGFESLPHAVTEGMLFPYPVKSPPASFTSRFESILGKPTAGLAAYGYDATMLILEALLSWGAEHPGQVPDGQVLAGVITGRGRYQGVTGRIGFRPNGENAEAAIPIYRWSGGALQQVSRG